MFVRNTAAPQTAARSNRSILDPRTRDPPYISSPTPAIPIFLRFAASHALERRPDLAGVCRRLKLLPVDCIASGGSQLLLLPLVSSPWSRLSPSPTSSRREAPTRVLRARPNEHPTARAPATLCRHPRSPPTPLRTSSRPQQSSTPRTIPSGVWRPPEQAPPSPPELPVPSFSTSDDAQLCSQVSTSPCRPIFFKRPGLDHLCFFISEPLSVKLRPSVV